jgi:hypothetical protein
VSAKGPRPTRDRGLRTVGRHSKGGTLPVGRFLPSAPLALLLAAVVLLGGLSISNASSGLAPDAPGTSPRSTDLVAPDASLYAQLQLANFTSPVNLSPEFIGVNVRADSPFTPADAQYLADTDALTWRYPGGSLAEDFDYPNDTIPTTGATEPNNLSNFVSLCAAVGCHAILQLPAEINDSAFDAYEVAYIQQNLTYLVAGTERQGFIPWMWELGNEPSLWTNFDVPWANWSTGDHSTISPSEYAPLVNRIVARILGTVNFTAPIDPIGGSGGNATEDPIWVGSALEGAGANSSYVSVHSYLEGNAAPNAPAFYAPLYKARNTLPTSLSNLRATIDGACASCADIGIVISEAGASNGETKNVAFESTFPMAMWDAVEAIQAAAAGVRSIDYFAYENEYPGSLVNASSGVEVLEPDYYLFKDVTPYLGSTVLNASLNNSDGGKLQVGAYQGPNDTWSLLFVNLDTVNSIAVNLTQTGVLPTQGQIQVYTWNASTPEPTGGSLEWLNSTVIAPNSLQFVTVAPTAPAVVPSSPRGLFMTDYNGSQGYVAYSQPSGPVTNDTLYYGTPNSTAPFCRIEGAVSAGAATGGILVSGLNRYENHCFEAQAWNSAGAGPISSILNVTALYRFPTAPTNVSVTRVGTTWVNLSWTNPGGGHLINDTVLEYQSSACTLLDRRSLGSVSVGDNVTGLTRDTYYCFAVQAWNQTGGSPISATVRVVTATFPEPPTDLAAPNVTNSSVELTWTNPAGGGLVNLTIFWGLSGPCRYTQVVSLGTVTDSWNASGLVTGTEYCFEVQAWNSTGHSARSAPLSVFTATSPGAPGGDSINNVGTTSLDLNWIDPPGGGLVNLTVYEGGASCLWSQLFSVGVTSSYLVTNLTPASSYCFAVQAWNSTGGSTLSAEILATTLPLPPTGLSAGGPTNDSITWDWTNPPGEELTDDEFYWAAGTACGSPFGNDLGQAQSSFTLDNLSSATEYCAFVVAVDLGGPSAPSLVVANWTLPDAPVAFAESAATPTSLSWTWTNPSGHLTGVDFSWSAGSTCGSPTTVQLDRFGTSYTLTGLDPAGQYCAFLTAVDNAGASVPTLTEVAVTEAIPAAPTNLIASSESATAVTLRWSATPGGAATNDTLAYGIQCGNWTAFVSTTGPATTWMVPGLGSGVTYCFEVESWTGSVPSAWSSPVRATTTEPSGAPASPTGANAVTLSSSSVALAWSNPLTVGLVNDTVIYSPDCDSSVEALSTAGAENGTTVAGLVPGTLYCFQVEAWNGAGPSEPALTNATTDGVPPAVSDLVAAQVGSTYARLTWADPPGTSNITVYLNVAPCMLEGGRVVSEGAADSSANLSGLTPSTSYCVYVQPWVDGAPGTTSHLTFTTLPLPSSSAANGASGIPAWVAVAGGLALGLVLAGAIALAFRRPKVTDTEERS